MKAILKQSIARDKSRLKKLKRSLGKPSEIRLNGRFDKRRGKVCYYFVLPDKTKEKYVKVEDYDTLIEIQEQEFRRYMVKALETNIEAKTRCLKQLVPTSANSIIATMPKCYRPITRLKHQYEAHQSENPYHKESLTIKTSFGLYVRSKGELAIAELLYSLGIKFYYEREITIKSSEHSGFVSYYPDFTIPIQNEEFIFWEHQGLLTDLKYIENNIRKQADYNYNGIYTGHNLIITSDGPDNALDLDRIGHLVMEWLMPMI